MLSPKLIGVNKRCHTEEAAKANLRKFIETARVVKVAPCSLFLQLTEEKLREEDNDVLMMTILEKLVEHLSGRPLLGIDKERSVTQLHTAIGATAGISTRREVTNVSTRRAASTARREEVLNNELALRYAEDKENDNGINII